MPAEPADMGIILEEDSRMSVALSSLELPSQVAIGVEVRTVCGDPFPLLRALDMPNLLHPFRDMCKANKLAFMLTISALPG